MTLTPTPKGYVITVTEKRKKHKYFLWDTTHTMDKYIPYILKHKKFKLGCPFGDDIYPIYISNYTRNNIAKDMSPVNRLSKYIKMRAIWNYYRHFCKADDTPKKVIKQYADELSSQLDLLGLDGLYEYVQNNPHI